MPMNKIIVALMVAFFLGSCCSFASAAPPVLSTVQSGSLEVIAPSFDTIPQLSKFDMYWHVFNTTNLLTNTTTTCDYHLYSKFANGEHLLAVNNVRLFSNGRDFEVEVTGGNFSQLGEYCHMIECNTSTQSGGLERCFTVTLDGNILTDSQTYVYLSALLILLVFGIFFFVLSIIFKHPAVKIFFISISSLTLLVIITTVIATVNKYASLLNVTLNLLNTYYILMTILIGGAAIGLMLWLIYYGVTLFNKTRGRYSEDD
jgi:hypothetical protein